MPARVLVVGSANVDYTVALPRLPVPGETVSEGTLLVNHGGKGANQAVAARRLGAEVRLVGCVGADAAGRAIVDALAAEGIGVSGVTAAEGVATGTALIAVDQAGRNQIAVAPGANRALDGSWVQARDADFSWAQVLVCQLEIPAVAVVEALTRARSHGILTILNPAPVPDSPPDLWALVDYLTPNRGEVERLGGMAGVAGAATALRERGVGTVVVTLGEDGALACGPSRAVPVPGFAVEAVDTTAAGDAFNAGLAVALAEGRELTTAVRFANAVGALACTRRGAQDSLPGRAAVDRLLVESPARDQGR
jgi:ribokinase